jgi:glycosyltransferase involved in cell wall biosynthesis
MNGLKISIITPSYNQGLYIEETILSVLSQNYGNREYLVLDGGSTDETARIIEKHRERIDYYVSERDSGMSDAINKGFRACHGDVIGWLNSDDTYLPGCLDTVASLFRTHPEVDVVYGDFVYTDEKNRAIRRKRVLRRMHRHFMMFENIIGQPSSFFRGRVIEKIGGLNEALSYEMDWEFYIRAMAAGCRFLHVRRDLSTYRLHRVAKSSQEGSARYDADLEKIRALARRTLGRGCGGAAYQYWRFATLLMRLYLVLRNNPFDYMRCFRQTVGCSPQGLWNALAWRFRH